MRAATAPRDLAAAERLIVLDAADPRGHRLEVATAGELARYVAPGDVVVLNDAATLPASIRARRPEDLELRFMGRDERSWTALLLGAGDRTRPTEARGPAPLLAPGDRVELDEAIALTVEAVEASGRVARVAVPEPEALLRLLALRGAPIQYAYVPGALSLFHVQTPWASRPWAFEMPSAGRPLTFATLVALRARGASVVRLTHAAGISSTGDAAVDATLPRPERFEIPATTAHAIAAARARGGRVIAVGTTVVRALEAAAADGVLRAGPGLAENRIDARTPRAIVDALLTGMHEPGTSHHRLLQAFAPEAALDDALARAAREGFLAHEFGDAMLILGPPPARHLGARRRDVFLAGRLGLA